MLVHLSLFDGLGAAALCARFKDRNPAEGSLVEKMWNSIGQFYANFDYTNILAGIESLGLKELKVLVLFYHMPGFYRKSYLSVSKDKLAPILAFKKVKVQELGFFEESKGHYRVD
jgi:hypothetical protein